MRELSDEQKKFLTPDQQKWLLGVWKEEEERESRPVELSRCPFCEEMKPRRGSDTFACYECVGMATNSRGEALTIGNYGLDSELGIDNTVTGQPHEGPMVRIRGKLGKAYAMRAGGVAVVLVR